MKAAIYARKSTDQDVADSEKSVTRQVDNARVFALARGWTVLEDHVYQDDGISGAELRKLRQKQRLLDTIRAGAPFQVLIMQSNDRLSRRDGDESFAELKSIANAGVEIWYYGDGQRFTFGDLGSNVTGYLKGEFAAEFRRAIAQKTREAMVRKAKAGHVTGGVVFGYDNLRVNSHVERRINQPQADIVLRIFQLCADGRGYGAIAKALNEERAVSPRSQGSCPGGWAPSSVREVLYRDLYQGLIVWNKTKKRSAQGDREHRREFRKRSESEWLKVDAPQLRIVPHELWQAVHARLGEIRKATLRMDDGKLLAGAPSVAGRPAKGGFAPYLLSGLLRCTCGSGYEALSRSSSKRRIFMYGCAAHKRKGNSVCSNGHLVPMEVADEAVLSKVEWAVFRPEVIEAVIERTLAELRADQTGSQIESIEQELREIKVALSNLIQLAAAGGGALATLAAAMGEHEARQRQLDAELAGLKAQQCTFDPLKARTWIEERLTNWKRLLRNNREQGRQVLQNVLTERLESDGLTFRGTAVLGRILRGDLSRELLASPTGTVRQWRLLLPGYFARHDGGVDFPFRRLGSAA